MTSQCASEEAQIEIETHASDWDQEYSQYLSWQYPIENVNIYIDKRVSRVLRGKVNKNVNMRFKVCYCNMIKTRGSNPMFWLKLHITCGGCMYGNAPSVCPLPTV